MSEVDERRIPVADIRAVVTASGELEAFDGPFFTNDVESTNPFWQSWWLNEIPPKLAKVEVKRKGVASRTITIAYDEFRPGENDQPEYVELWADKPMIAFGAAIERHAFRVVFGDILAPLFAPRIVVGNVDPSAIPTNDRIMVIPDDRPAAGWDLPARDWFADVKAADAQALNALTDEARAAGALAKVDGLQQAFMDRLLELEQAKRPKPAPRPVGDKLAPKGKPKQRRRRPRPDEVA